MDPLHLPMPQTGTYVIGGNGSGKSSYLALRMLRDAEAGKGLVLIDPKGNAAEGSLADFVAGHLRRPFLTLDAESANFGIDPLACSFPENPGEVEKVRDRVMEIFTRVFDLDRNENPRLRSYLRNSVGPLIVHRRTLADLPDFLTDQAFRRRLLDRIDARAYREARRFWQMHDEIKPETQKLDRIESTMSRVGELLGTTRSDRIFGRHANTIDWRSVLEKGQIVLVRLDPELPELSSLVGAVLMAQIATAVFARQERDPFALYADEYHLYATSATDKLLTMGRGFGIETTIAHQARSQLSNQTKGATLQAGNLVVFRVGVPDNNELAGMFKVPEDHPELINRIARQAVDHAPVGSLLSGKHDNPRIRELVERHLRPLANAYDREGSRDSWRQDYAHRFDRYYVDLMEGTLAPGSDQEASRLGDVVDGVRDKLDIDGWSSGLWGPFRRCFAVASQRVISGDGNWDVVAVCGGKAWAEDARKAIAWEREKEPTWNVNRPEQGDAATGWTASEERAWHAAMDIILDRENPMWSQRVGQAEKQREAIEHAIWERQHRERCAAWAERERRSVAEGLALAKSELAKFKERFVPRVEWIVELGRLLVAEPLKVNTDVWDDQYARPRSVEDRIRERANELVGLGLGEAYVKLWLGASFWEGKVRFPPPPRDTGYRFTPPVEEPPEPFFDEEPPTEAPTQHRGDGPPPI